MTGIRVHNVYAITGDMEASIAFYRDVLGLDVKFRDGENWCQLAAGDTRLALSSPEEAAPATSGNVVVFAVGDIEAMAAKLAAAGIAIEAERDMGAHGRIIACRDPNGAVIQLYQAAAG